MDIEHTIWSEGGIDHSDKSLPLVTSEITTLSKHCSGGSRPCVGRGKVIFDKLRKICFEHKAFKGQFALILPLVFLKKKLSLDLIDDPFLSLCFYFMSGDGGRQMDRSFSLYCYMLSHRFSYGEI